MADIGEATAIRNAGELVEAARPVTSEQYEVKSTYKAEGRWRIKLDVDGVYDTVIVRLDGETGNPAEDEGHRRTSQNLYE